MITHATYIPSSRRHRARMVTNTENYRCFVVIARLALKHGFTDKKSPKHVNLTRVGVDIYNLTTKDTARGVAEARYFLERAAQLNVLRHA